MMEFDLTLMMNEVFDEKSRGQLSVSRSTTMKKQKVKI